MKLTLNNYGRFTEKTFRAAFLAVFFVPLLISSSFTAQEEGVYSSSITSYPTQGLSPKERSSLEKEYQFMVRGKDKLLIPVTGSAAVPLDRSPAFGAAGESYRRYVDAAIELYKAGRLEESMKIFKYLNEVDPGDDYIKSYLSRLQREVKEEGTGWENRVAAEASSIKKNKVKSLLRDGAEFYNNKDFDNALVCFNDALAVDPENPDAKKYMNKLKEHYLKKREAEEIVGNLEKKGPSYFAEKPGPYVDPSSPHQKIADTMMDKTGALSNGVAEVMLDDAQMKKIAADKKAEDLLKEIGFGLEADAIIAANRAEKIRADQMMLGSGDLLRMSVMNHPELSGEMAVQSNGYVSLPLVGDEIAASGFTIDELNDKVTKAVGKYVEAPKVSVFMITSRSQMFYVIDEISCTPYPITRPNFTLRDALFLSDWGDNRALGRVIVIKPSAHNPIIKKVDAFNIIFRGDLRDNIRITNGDVIYIPLTWMAKVTKGVYDSLSPLSAASSVRDQYLNLKWNEKDYKDFFRMPKDFDAESESAASGFGGVGYLYYSR